MRREAILWKQVLTTTFAVAMAVVLLTPDVASAGCGRDESGEENYFEWTGKLAEALVYQKSDIVAERVESVRCLAQFPASQAREYLVIALEDDAADVQLAAVEAIGAIRIRSAVKELLPMLDHRDAGVRAATAESLGALGDRVAVDGLIVALSDPSGDVRQATIHALGSLRDPRSIGPLTESLEDDARDVVIAAIDVLATFGDETTVYALLDKTHDSSVKVKERAVKALGELRDPRATSTLIGLLKGQPTNIRRTAIKALAEMGDPTAVEPLLALLNPNDSPELLVSVVKTLGALGDARSVEPLLSMVRHDLQRRACSSAIIEIGEPAIDLLIGELEGADQAYRTELLRMLARIPSDTSEQVLIEALESGRFPREDVVLAVSQIQDPQMLEVLTLVLADLTEQELVKVLSRVQNIADDRMVRPLVERYPELGTEARVVVLATFAAIGDSAALPVVIEEMGNTDAKVRRHAIHAAQAIGDPGAVDSLSAVLRHRDTTTEDSRATSGVIRRQAALALAGISSEKSVAKLLKAARNTDHPARREAMWALGFAVRGQDGSEAADLVREILEDPTHPLAYTSLETVATLKLDDVVARFDSLYDDGRFSVRRKIVEVIGFMGADAVPILNRALIESDRTVRTEAVWVAGILGVAMDDDALIALADDPDPALATNALATAGRLGVEKAVPVLQRRLYDGSPFVAANALWALNSLGQTPEAWELELLLSRATNPFLRATLYESLEQVGATEILERELARESSDTIRRQMVAFREGKEAQGTTEWLLVDVTDRGGQRVINERAYFLMPDGSIKAAWSDENGKIRIELGEPGVVRQLYDRNHYDDFGVRKQR